MRVLLTGAAGQLGRCVLDAFRDSDFELIALGRESLNIADGSEVEQAISKYKPDIVINAAAFTAVDHAESVPELADQINHAGPGNLARAAQRHGVLLIHISTDYVFDGKKSEAYTEEDLAKPRSVYGETKLKGERAVQEYCEKFVIIRTSWVFGEYGNNFVKTMLRLGLQRDELGVVADQVGCPTYAGDIANACLAVCRAEREGRATYGVFHFAGSESVSWFDFAQMIFSAASQSGVLERIPVVKPITTDQYPTQAERPANSRLSSTKFLERYDYSANDLSDCLEKVIVTLAKERGLN